MAPFTSFRLTAQVELLLLVHDLVVGLDHVVLAAALGAGPRRLGAALLGTGSGRLLLPLPGLVERGTGGRVRRVELVSALRMTSGSPARSACLAPSSAESSRLFASAGRRSTHSLLSFSTR